MCMCLRPTPTPRRTAQSATRPRSQRCRQWWPLRKHGRWSWSQPLSAAARAKAAPYTATITKTALRGRRSHKIKPPRPGNFGYPSVRAPQSRWGRYINARVDITFTGGCDRLRQVATGVTRAERAGGGGLPSSGEHSLALRCERPFRHPLALLTVPTGSSVRRRSHPLAIGESKIYVLTESAREASRAKARFLDGGDPCAVGDASVCQTRRAEQIGRAHV